MMKSVLFLCAVALCLQYAAAADCAKLSVVSGACPTYGFALASSDAVTACQAELCAIVDKWQMVGYGSPNWVFAGYGYDVTCGTQYYPGTTSDVICEDRRPATPMPTPRPATWSPGVPPSPDGGNDDGGLPVVAIVFICFLAGGFVSFVGGFAYYQVNLRGSEAIPLPTREGGSGGTFPQTVVSQ